MRSPKPEKTFSSNEDLWDNPEHREDASRPRDARGSTQNSKGIEDASPSVIEIVTDPWSETSNSSENKQKKD